MSNQKPKKTKIKLPQRVLPIECSDKDFMESWYKGRDMLDFPKSYALIAVGLPHSGKSCLFKNIIIRANPPFSKIVVIHYDPNTTEYDDLDNVEILTEIPGVEYFLSKEKRTLVILDDINLEMSKEQKGVLDRLFGYVCSHLGVSVMMSSQDAFRLPPIVRRCANIFVFWKIHDLDSLSCLGRKIGMKTDDFKYIFDNFLKKRHDHLMIDMTKNTPYPMRINSYQILERNDEKK